MATMSELLEENQNLRQENEKLRTSLREALECIEQAALASRRLDDMVGELVKNVGQSAWPTHNG